MARDTVKSGKSRILLMAIASLQVYPFVKQLKAWIKREKRRLNGSNRTRHSKGSNSSSKPPSSEQAGNHVLHHSTTAMETRSVALKEPGQQWLNFKFCREDILKHLIC